MNAPLILFVYKRHDHLKKTLMSLSENDLSRETDLFIFSDAPKKTLDESDVNKVRDYIKGLKSKKIFKSVTIYEAKINKGLANSVIDGVTQIIKKYSKVIVLEDDLVVSKYFLDYMNNALNYYENCNYVWSISGYSPPIKIPKYYYEEVYLSYRASSWGWATWLDRWEKVDWNVSDYRDFLKDKKRVKNFLKGGYDLLSMLNAQMESKIDSWAIRWCYSQSSNRQFSVTPTISYVNNIGLDGSGTHSPISNDFDTELNNKSVIKLSPVKINKLITKRFQNHFLTFHRYVLSKIKRKINSISGGKK